MANEPPRIARTVEAFVVLFDTAGPLPEPRHQRCYPRLPCRRVTLQDLPLTSGRLPCFVQDFGRNLELAEIVQHRAPPQEAPFLVGKPHLLCDHVGKRTDLLAMAACLAVMAIERLDERERLNGGRLGVRRQPVLTELGKHLFRLRGVPDPQRDLHSTRCFFREGQIDLTQRRQRQQRLRAGVDERTHHRRQNEHGNDPQTSGGQRPPAVVEHPAQR